MSGEDLTQKPEEKITPAFFADIPEYARDRMTSDWQVPAELTPERQFGRIMVKAQDILDGHIPEGVDKNRAKAEAGRVLSHLRQELEDEEFMSGMDPKQRDYFKSEVEAYWTEGGQEANESWKVLMVPAQDPTPKGEPKENNSERVLNRLSEMTANIQKIYDVSVRSLDGAIEFVKTNFPDDKHRIQSLEISRKILSARIDPQTISAQFSQSLLMAQGELKQEFNTQGQKAENDRIILSEVRGKYAKLMQSSFIAVLNGLQSGIDMEDNQQIKTVLGSVHKDIEGMIAATGGVRKIVAEPGAEIDFDTMEPSDFVETRDPKYKGKEVIASVGENGYIFDQDLQLFEGQGTDVVSPAKVEVYKYQE